MIPLINSQTRRITRRIRQTVRQWRRRFTLDHRSRIARNIILLLFLNVVFACIEWFYGDRNNSRALKADCLRRFYDCSNTLVNVVVIRTRNWEANLRYTYGYARAEMLAGFAIGLTQVYLALMEIFRPAIPLLINPDEVKPEWMIVISVVGLLLKLINYYVSLFLYISEEKYPLITEGIIYSILVDVFGSVALVASAVATEIFRSMIADSICSIIIALCMILIVVPVLKDNGEILLQRQPVELDDFLPACYRRVEALPGVERVLNAHFWTLHSDGDFVGSLVLEVVDLDSFDSNEIVRQVRRIFAQVDETRLTVELRYSIYT